VRRAEPLALITGGAGFVGTNLAARLVADGHRVRVLDSFARRGVEQNCRWLVENFSDDVQVATADVRDPLSLRRALVDVDQVFHLAAQVAVTTSLLDPQTDLEVNVLGTVALLEELRRLDDPPPLIFTSTNKVYGTLPDIALERVEGRWQPLDPELLRHGIDERRPLDFCTPYGCSKGAADQYVLDYAQSYGLPAAVFRMSCIYGPHQHGTEDQGWVAHFLIQALADEPITVYGDGGQVRDLLFVEDLVEACTRGRDAIDRISGLAFNIGGGPDNVVSVLEVVEMVGERYGRRPQVRFGDERIGDQRYYVSDTRRFAAATGWRPAVDVDEGLDELYGWLRAAGAKRLKVRARAAAR
jgi:CDP-paratose 2-epimerase